MFNLNVRSEKNLAGVHPDLCLVIRKATLDSDLEFIVTEGVRTKEKQLQLYNAGASKTLNSRHLTGHAVDVAVLVAGEVRWDWPLYKKVSEIILNAAKVLNIPVVWGGSWKTFKDGPHFELDRTKYP
jgi:peptidoglycan L-alanyl-D-glutamate endopeptidase CwlK